MKKNFECNATQHIIPYGKNVLIQLDKNDQAISGGIILTDTPSYTEDRGTVLAVGDQVKELYPELVPGCHVVFDKYHQMDLDRKDIKMISCVYIWFIFDDENVSLS